MTTHQTLAALVALGRVVVAPARPVRALEKLTLQVSPTVGIAPAYVRIRALVEHDSENRAIEIIADSDNFYRRSVVQLDGETAPKVNELLLKRAVAHRTVEILASGSTRE